MILRGVNVRILVDDIATMYDFYTEKLGFKVIYGSRTSKYVAFAEKDKTEPAFAIFLKVNMNDYNGYLPLPQSSKSDQVVCCTELEDVDGFYAELKNRGVDLMGEPQNVADWEMRCFYFRDPEGNLFEVSGAIK